MKMIAEGASESAKALKEEALGDPQQPGRGRDPPENVTKKEGSHDNRHKGNYQKAREDLTKTGADLGKKKSGEVRREKKKTHDFIGENC